MTALGAILGRKIGIKPQMKTDWIEIPNLWGAFIGPPGMLKSPAMNEALRPLHRLEAEAIRNHEIAQQAYAAGLDAFRLRKQVATALAKEELKRTLKGNNHTGRIDLQLGEQPQPPTPVRYRTNDTSYEALAELIVSNPWGLLVERDELVSLLRHLDRNDQAVARGFFLTGWSGTQPYTLDRISRGCPSHRGGLHFRPRELATGAHCGVRETRQHQCPRGRRPIAAFWIAGLARRVPRMERHGSTSAQPGTRRCMAGV